MQSKKVYQNEKKTKCSEAIQMLINEKLTVIVIMLSKI